ncbi:MAG: type II toxin-antitoxin system HicB family antitoxin [Luteolibacter sp.]
MNYAIAIEQESGKAYGVQVPDLPGCYSAGDTMDEAIANAAEAIAFHIEGLLDAGEKIPSPKGVEAHTGNPNYSGMIWALVSVDFTSLSGKAKRLNISLPERVLRRIDSAAERNGETRSGFIARIALEAV